MIDALNKPKQKSSLNKRLLILVDKSFEDLELWYTKIRLAEAGADVIIVGAEIKEYTGLHGLTAIPEIIMDKALATEYDGIIIPGGYAPDFLRRYEVILKLVHDFNEQKKLVAFICHAGWVPISAKILKNRQATGLIAIKDDLINAGAIWKDEPVVIDDNLISSRRPNDLPCFCDAIINFLQNA